MAIEQRDKESPLYTVTTKEVQAWYNFVYMFVLDLRSRGVKSVRYSAAMKAPGWAAAEIIFLALYGYTKKMKFAKSTAYWRWSNAPKTLEGRVMMLLGKEGQSFRSMLDSEGMKVEVDEASEFKIEPDKAFVPSSVAGMDPGIVDEAGINRRMQRYIQDFDLHSAIDNDLLKNLVVTQILIETEQNMLLRGRTSGIDLPKLTGQVQIYTNLLGLSKKDRLDFGAERKKGSIADLVSVYEDTKREYVDFEIECLREELEVLLNKHQRRTPDGDRELSDDEFRIVSGGFTVAEATEYLGKVKK